jgi:hypothetical protein
VSECQSPTIDESLEVHQVKSMNHEGLVSDSDWTRSEWQQVDLLEFPATTIDLRIVLFQVDLLTN